MCGARAPILTIPVEAGASHNTDQNGVLKDSLRNSRPGMTYWSGDAPHVLQLVVTLRPSQY